MFQNSNQNHNIIILDDFHPVFLEKLNAAGLKVDYKPDFNLDKDIDKLKDYGIAAVRSKINFNAELLKTLPQMHCIARGGAGMDNIDEKFATACGITLLNAPEGNRDAVAEHSLALLLCLSRNIIKSYEQVRQYIWLREENRGWELGNKTIGIIGFGNAGSAFAKKLSGLGVKVFAYDKYIKVDSEFAFETDLHELLANSDAISFHIPLNKETKYTLNEELISQMKDSVVIVNTSRGSICKIEDVLKGIKSGKIKGFATDVLENENFESLSLHEKNILDEMMLSNQVIITPHIAGWSVESYEKIASILADKIVEYTTNAKNIRMKVD